MMRSNFDPVDQNNEGTTANLLWHARSSYAAILILTDRCVAILIQWIKIMREPQQTCCGMQDHHTQQF